MFLIWLFGRIVLIRFNPDIIYYTLRWLVVMFLAPVAFGAILLSYRNSYILENGHLRENFVFPINFEQKYFYVIAAVWFAAAVINAVRFTIKSKKKYELCLGNIPEDDSLALELFEDMKKELGIRRRLGLCRNDLLASPVVTGVFRQTVILPYQHYEKDELRVIFMHELTHIKKHDLFYKALAILILTIQSFNPCAYILNRLIDKWSEQDCDRKVTERLRKEGLTSKDYFKVIWEFIEPEKGTKRDIYIFSMLFEDRDMLERRIEFMNKYGNTNKKAAKIITTALVTVFMLAGTMTSYAAGVEIAEANDSLFKETQEIGLENEAFPSVEEFSVSAEENALVKEVCMETEIMPLAGDSFDWTIPVGTRYVTTEKWFSKGTKVDIALTVKPDGCTYWYGLMYPSSSSSVCETTGGGMHTFEVPSSGFYRVLVENRSSKEIRAVGGYQY